MAGPWEAYAAQPEAPAQGPWTAFQTAPDPKPSDPTTDKFLASTGVGRVLDAFGQGLKDGWGTEPLGIPPDVEKGLRDAGIFKDVDAGRTGMVRAFNEAFMRPAAAAADATMRAGTAALYGVGGAIGQLTREPGTSPIPGDSRSLEEVVGQPGSALTRDLIGMAINTGVIGTGRVAPHEAFEPTKLGEEAKPGESAPTPTPEPIKAEVPAPSESVVSDTTPPPPREQAAPSRPDSLFDKSTDGPVDKAGNINLERIAAPEDVKDVIRNTADQNEGFQSARRGTISLGETADLADALGMRPEDLDTRRIGQAFNAEEITAARQLLVQSATNMRDLAVRAGSGEEADVLGYAQAELRHKQIQEQVAGLTAEAGRALNAFKILAGDVKDAENLATLSDKLKAATGDTLDGIKARAKAVSELDTPQQVSSFLNDSRKPTFGQKFLYYWTNNLLSGPFTHTAYGLQNALFAAWSVPETALAAGIGKARSLLRGEPSIGDIRAQLSGLAEHLAVGDELAIARAQELHTELAALNERVMPAEIKARLYGLVQGSIEGIPAGWRALKSGVPEVLPGESPAAASATGYVPGARSSMPLGNSIIGDQAAAIVGNAVGTPTRVIGGIHSFFRAVSYRQEINAQAARAASREGLSGVEFDRRVEELTKNPTDEMTEKAIGAANYQAFVNELGEWGQKVQGLTQGRGGMAFGAKMIVPFIRTPGDLFKAAVERTPLPLVAAAFRTEGEVSRNLRGENGAIAQDTQLARLALGSSVAIAAVTYAAQDNITGDGPANPDERAVWLLTHQAHSIKIGNTWVDYSKVTGPIGTVARAAANLYSVAGKVAETDYNAAASAFTMALSHLVIDDAPGMRGLSDMLEAIKDKTGTKASQFIRNMAASVAIPFSTGLGQTASMFDDSMRHASNLIDGLKLKIPGERQTLTPVRDLWGEAIPNAKEGEGAIAAQARVSQDPVSIKMNELRVWPAPPERQINGVKLTDQQYDDYSRIAGRFAKSRLDSMINVDGFDQLPVYYQQELIRNTIDQSRATARTYLQMTEPDILRHGVQQKVDQITKGKHFK